LEDPKDDSAGTGGDYSKEPVTVDWTLKKAVRAKLRVMARHILKKYGYPPDKREKATLTVLEQAKLLCKDWTETTAGATF
jgi:hypothetical protein